MESLEYTQLDESVITVAGVMEHAKEGRYEEFAAELEDDARNPKILETVWGAGYRLNA